MVNVVCSMLMELLCFDIKVVLVNLLLLDMFSRVFGVILILFVFRVIFIEEMLVGVSEFRLCVLIC